MTFSSAPRTPEPSTAAPRESQPSYDEEPPDASEHTTEFRDEEPAPIAEDDFAADAEDFRAERDDDEREDLGEGRERDFDREEGEADARPRHRQGDRGDRGDGRDRRRGRRTFSRPGNMRPKPLIQDIFKRGQEVLVQVIKEGIGTKGPTLSTYISIAGRYLVLMPGLNRIGVSRKITDDDQRRRLRDILSELEPPRGLGFIIRTAGLDRTKKELQRDLAY
ncbi:MAG: ribonuclease E/G, partial [Solimonas sp.]